MTTLKAIIAALTLVAVAANPVAASILPCCCVIHVESERSCCRAAEVAAKSAEIASLPACCAKKHLPVDTIVRSGCCCVKAPPAVPASPDQTKQIIEQPSIEPSCSSVDCLVYAPATSRFEQVPGSLTLTGPPLLALYCIWLK